jgi:ribonuclease D
MTLINNSKELSDVCNRLANEKFLAIDTEFMRERTYYPQLCLIQIAGENEAVIIDALAPNLNLEPLLKLMADEKIIKVFHACRQDMEIFFNLNRKIPTPFFDTQIGAMVCGYGDSVSYDKLVKTLIGIQIDKSSRFTDWSHRPLSKQQLEYALSDVTHLRTVYELLSNKLKKNGRRSWLDEELKVLKNPHIYEVPPDEAWKRLKVKSGKPGFLILVKELSAYREHEARRRDVPRNRIIRDDVLLDIAARSPQSPNDLAKVRNLTTQFAVGKLGQSILQTVQKARQTPESEAPKLQQLENFRQQKSAIVDLLKVLLKLKSEDHDVAQKLIANTADLEEIANNDEANVSALKGWRKDIFGNDALLLKAGKIALSASGDHVELIRL